MKFGKTAISYYAPDETVVKLGIHEGLGLEKTIGNQFSIFTEIQYTYLFMGSLTKEYIWDYNDDPDLKLSYLTLFAGIRFSLLKRDWSTRFIRIEGFDIDLQIK